MITSTDGRLDLGRALPSANRNGGEMGVDGSSPETAAPGRVWTAAELAELERSNIERALAACSGKVSGRGGAAELLGMPPSTLSSRIRALGLKP